MPSLTYLMLAFAAAATSWPQPTSAEMAEAIGAFTGKPIQVADVRSVRCSPIEEEPTEAVCKWQQRSGKGWQRYSTYVAVDGNGWLLIDTPRRIP